MRRGEIWWANLPPPAGRRPVLLLSRDEAYAVREYVTVALVTTRVRGLKAEVPLGSEDGLDRASVANLDNINTIPKTTLIHRLGTLTHQKLKAVEKAIRFALGFSQ